ncbi:MAG: T9SS type A sorting domain-containing protein [Candidatus Latescibacteria bacterium]|nr:T9SS type A sorting domain-containing protein [Candidatus Latescibacterota bacterium]
MDTIYAANTNLVDMMVTGYTGSHPAFNFGPLALTAGVTRVVPGGTLGLPIVFSPVSLGEVEAQLIIETNLSSIPWDLRGVGAKEVVVINEVLADPPAGSGGDANGDGVRNSNEDEFVELLNTGKYSIGLGGWQLFDAGASLSNRFTFPNEVQIGPNERVVVFGGGKAQTFTGQVFTDDGKIGGGLRNSGDGVFLVNTTTGDTVAQVVYGAEGGRNQSLVRSPEGTGSWAQHSAVSVGGVRFSPGTASSELDMNPLLIRLEVSVIDSHILVGDVIPLTVIGVFTNGPETLHSIEYVTFPSDSTVVGVENGELTANNVGRCALVVEYAGRSSEIGVEVYAPGDLNLDGRHTLWDAIRVVQIILGIGTGAEVFERRSADLNKDDELDIRDLMRLIQHIVGGPVISKKPVLRVAQVGWEHAKNGVRLSVPLETRAISFVIEGYANDFEPSCDLGDLWIQDNGTDRKGVVLLRRGADQHLPTRQIQLVGFPSVNATNWMAWTLDGRRFPLNHLGTRDQGVRLVSVSPNPFNPEAVITYSVEYPQEVQLDIYNVIGQHVRKLYQGQIQQGVHTVIWDTKDALGRSVGSGLYFANLQGVANYSTLKMIVLR